MRGMCFNWKVIAGLAVLGLGAWLWAPSLTVAALPLLLAVACPISMLLMMRGMHSGRCGTEAPATTQPTPVSRSRSEQLADLRTQLGEVQSRQQAIGRQIVELEADATSVRDLPGPREAEAPAAAAAHG